jgi:RNA polymerase sigma factor (sigma-70 family)
MCSGGQLPAAGGGVVNRPPTPGEAPDTLALRYQHGDPDALADLYSALEPALRSMVWRTCQRGLPTTLQAADLQQQSWLILAELARRWEPRAGVPFAAYLALTFPWALGRYLRAQSPARRSIHYQVYSAPHDRLVASLTGSADDDGRDWDERLYCQHLVGAVEPRARTALWLHAVEHRSFTEIAAALGVPRATAYDLYRRAVASARRAA